MLSIKNTSFIFFEIFFMLLCFSACSKKAFATEKITKTKDVQEINQFSKDLIKLDSVLLQMNSRAKEFCDLIKNNKNDFLLDLSKVLLEEKRINKGDISLLTLIDKKHVISKNYEPINLIELKSNEPFQLNKSGMKIRPEAYEALKEMSLAAQKDGINLLVSSVYRSYQYQENLFNYWVSVDGLEEAERESARPGTSQHQLATAIDFGSISDDFDKTKMGQWLYKNASKYGWSLSFPENYEDVTGYRFECWHFRYIGIETCRFQQKWFGDIQQFALEFLNEWK